MAIISYYNQQPTFGNITCISDINKNCRCKAVMLHDGSLMVDGQTFSGLASP